MHDFREGSNHLVNGRCDLEWIQESCCLGLEADGVDFLKIFETQTLK
jgi:hypothetical protein